ncbi:MULTISPECIES: hypothetical protein [Enterococcus]|uniref:WxL domain-containing protein n=1 Tax=Candidatus Enterococcus mangumiae TaxID=2230878 RepID=A0ABZ2T0N1_9ENTE|nr:MULTISPECIES: hypothetical protein [unclassified Enterococcus]MBO0462323.1 hypothetical protein [Enterococcus sp. DIV1298c]MBO0490580.1 hypothetical protein [Enterococcus sp. DIV1094]MBO1300884.1 hypothetical protein [Enterococcus sp. DIV1271a]
MKRATKLVLSILTVTGVCMSGATAFANPLQTIDGREGTTSGDITIKGIIGEFDNTKPGPNPENLDRWINVTIPTTAIFHTTEESEHKKITSPSYQVTNHSALSVRATVSNVTEIKEMSEVDRLTINTIELFNKGVSTVTATPLFTLSGNQGSNTVGNFQFIGDATPKNASVESNPSFNLVLNFAVEA